MGRGRGWDGAVRSGGWKEDERLSWFLDFRACFFMIQIDHFPILSGEVPLAGAEGTRWPTAVAG